MENLQTDPKNFNYKRMDVKREVVDPQKDINENIRRFE